MHLVHIKDGTDDEYLVVGVLFDVSEYGYNVEVRAIIRRIFSLSHPRLHHVRVMRRSVRSLRVPLMIWT